MKLCDSLLVITALLLAGCTGGPAGPPLVPVEGIVTLDAKPLSGAVLLFQPQGNTEGQGGTARTGADGKFALSSFDLQAKGAAAGSYRVTISKKVKPDGSDFLPNPDEDPMLAAYKEILPPQYTDDAQTTLSAEIPTEGAKSLEFQLSSKLK
jgi:hypothetical protein